jgi:hypothetical protein
MSKARTYAYDKQSDIAVRGVDLDDIDEVFAEFEIERRGGEVMAGKSTRDVIPAATCTWTYDPDGYWQTQCGDQFCFSEGGPTENRVKFCHYCGREMVESVYANQADEEGDD